jgi:hypothetical protein
VRISVLKPDKDIAHKKRIIAGFAMIRVIADCECASAEMGAARPDEDYLVLKSSFFKLLILIFVMVSRQ